jgi:Uma2 family endonuclease
MSALLSDDRDARERGGPVRHAFTVAEYYRMAEAGVLPPGRRTELIDGDVIEMSPIGTKHAACVTRLQRTLSSRLGTRADVRVQQPVRLTDASEPEPDVALVARRGDDYEAGHPTPADVLLVVEVSDTTLAFDRAVKAPLYAQAGIVEYWLVDLANRLVEVHRSPSADGYREVIRAVAGDTLSPSVLPDVRIAVDEVFGPGAGQ